MTVAPLNLELKTAINKLPSLKNSIEKLAIPNGVLYLGTVLDGLPLLFDTNDEHIQTFFIFGQPNVYNIIVANRKLGTGVEIVRIVNSDFSSNRANELIYFLRLWCEEAYKYPKQCSSMVVFVEDVLFLENNQQALEDFIIAMKASKKTKIKFMLCGTTYNPDIWERYIENKFGNEHANLFSFYENGKKLYFYIPEDK